MKGKRTRESLRNTSICPACRLPDTLALKPGTYATWWCYACGWNNATENAEAEQDATGVRR